MKGKLRIGFLGGMPSSMAWGGLEFQIERTAKALESRGHQVIFAQSARTTDWDILHVFGSEPDTYHVLSHWRLNRVPYVISPVLSVRPGIHELLVHLGGSLSRPMSANRMRRLAIQGSAEVVTLTQYERAVVRRLTRGRCDPIIVPNGVDPVRPSDRAIDPGYILMLGAINEKKGQLEAIRALNGIAPIVVVGQLTSMNRRFRSTWTQTVALTDATWLGYLDDANRIARLQRDAYVLVHMSAQEVQSLAVLETLAQGTRVILSDIPSHRELLKTYPGWVSVASSKQDLVALAKQMRMTSKPQRVARLPSWQDVARDLELVYMRVLARRVLT